MVGGMADNTADSAGSAGGDSGVTVEMIERLQVRNEEGRIVPLTAGPIQREFERRHGQQNIVLKTRQSGMTTWTVARFLMRTLTRPGTTTLVVVQSMETVPYVIRMIKIMHESAGELSRGQRAQVGKAEIAFPEIDSRCCVTWAGSRDVTRGIRELKVDNLHCSELARWDGDAAKTMARLRAVLTSRAEVVIEGTPWGAGGCFYDEWQQAGEIGMVRHFFPWWMVQENRGRAVSAATLTREERGLVERVGLTMEQVGFRRRIHRESGKSGALAMFLEDAEGSFRESEQFRVD
jgi:hypothetical protein